MKTYKAKKNPLIHLMLIASLALAVVLFFFGQNTIKEKPCIRLPVLTPFLLLLWAYLDTFYAIENQEFKYRSAFLRGSIKISDIREIHIGKTKWVGTKPALAQKGLIIKYNQYDEIYIAPKRNDELISDLLKINPGIKLIE